MLSRLVREPLVHFLALALLIFAVYGVLDRSSTPARHRIVVTDGKIEQIAGIFAKTWQRPPTMSELKGLIDDYVKEEVYYREAMALGLDQDDTVIRRRLRLKFEFLNDVELEALKPTDAQLEAYLTANPAKFTIDPAFAFKQIYFSRERRGDRAAEDAASILETLRADPSLDPATLGDTTLLPPELPLSSTSSIGHTFGREFSDAISSISPLTWSGPIKSGLGLHLVRVGETKPGRLPPLAEVREAVAREWTNEKRKEISERRLSELLKRYEIIVETDPDSPGGAAGKP